MRLYTTWRNVSINDRGEPVVCRDIHNRCRHCLNIGIVILDTDEYSDVAAPCAMCTLGGRRAVEWATGQLAPNRYGFAAEASPPETYSGLPAEHYWHGVDMDGVSWANGLTYRHDRVCVERGCGRLVTRTGACESHTVAVAS